MDSSGKRWLILLAVVLALVAALRVGRVLNRSGDLSELRASLATARAAADSCRADLAASEGRLREYHGRLDTLRSRVRAFEALDPRGVPADSYQVYMGAFGSYNDSAATWQGRVDTLQAQLARCRTLTESHNLLADSLRRVLPPR